MIILIPDWQAAKREYQAKKADPFNFVVAPFWWAWMDWTIAATALACGLIFMMWGM
jgi:hypothetical protein